MALHQESEPFCSSSSTTPLSTLLCRPRINKDETDKLILIVSRISQALPKIIKTKMCVKTPSSPVVKPTMVDSTVPPYNGHHQASSLSACEATIAAPTRPDSAPTSSSFLVESSAEEQEDDGGTEASLSSKKKPPVKKGFPLKLYALLEDDPETSDVASWQPGGQSFKVHKPKAFSAEMLPRRFKQTKYKSFLRQLNIYGFQRIQHGPNKGGYAHSKFLRGERELCSTITREFAPKRTKAAATRKKAAESDRKDAAFYAAELTPSSSSSSSSSSFFTGDSIKPSCCFPPQWDRHHHQEQPQQQQDNPQELAYNHSIMLEEHDFFSHLFPITSSNKEKDPALNMCHIMDNLLDDSNISSKNNDDDVNFSEPHPLGNLPQQQDLMSGFLYLVDNVPSEHNHHAEQEEEDIQEDDGAVSSSFDDFLFTSFDDKQQPNPSVAAAAQNDEQHHQQPQHQQQEDLAALGDLGRSECTFPAKLHRMLEDSEQCGNSHIVSWMHGGTAFMIHDNVEFFEKVLPNYFEMTKMASFRRQINLYGFTRKTTKQNHPSGVSYFEHKHFVRHDPCLCQHMLRTRSSSSSSARRVRGPASSSGASKNTNTHSINKRSSYEDHDDEHHDEK